MVCDITRIRTQNHLFVCVKMTIFAIFSLIFPYHFGFLSRNVDKTHYKHIFLLLIYIQYKINNIFKCFIIYKKITNFCGIFIYSIFLIFKCCDSIRPFAVATHYIYIYIYICIVNVYNYDTTVKELFLLIFLLIKVRFITF